MFATKHTLSYTCKGHLQAAASQHGRTPDMVLSLEKWM
jgi:hypothetical protein